MSAEGFLVLLGANKRFLVGKSKKTFLIGFTAMALLAMAAVDVEDESILASIFKDSFPDSWRDNPDFTAYLSELSSFGLDKLSREPERLAEERAQILQQTRELAFSNYQTFIRTADCTEHIYRDFGRVESSVSRLLDKLPGFGEKCRSVAERRNHLSNTFK